MLKKENTAKAIILKKIKDSTAKPNSNTPSGGKIIGIEPDIRFYEIEDSDNTE